MSNGWDAYYVVFVSGILAMAIPLSLVVLSRFFRQSGQSGESGVGQNEIEKLGARINSRYFLAASVATVLISTALLLIPCIAVQKAIPPETVPGVVNTEESLAALLAILSLAGLVTVGLLYSANKGDLSWLKSFQKED